jgi:predicted hydrolase (HD superfamily)
MADTAVDLAAWAHDLAAQELRDLGSRWHHVQSVGRLAGEVGKAFGTDRETLVAAALLHDIGYSPRLAITGFHPLDGARYVRDVCDSDLAELVAHHSGARNEARLRGLSNALSSEFMWHDTPLAAALTYCDLTTGPTGLRVRLHDRVSEIVQRYGADHPVSQAIQLGVPYFQRAVDDTERRMTAAGVVLTGSLAYPD